MVSGPIDFNWSETKNEWLIRERNISFDDVVFHIRRGDVLDIAPNPNYPGQGMYVLRIGNYAWIVPFVKEDSSVFLKTVYPSRKATRTYLAGELEEQP